MVATIVEHVPTVTFLQNSGGGELTVSAHHRRSFGEIPRLSSSYEVINYLWSVEKFGLRSETDPGFGAISAKTALLVQVN